jgi:hypothetical protein
MLTLEAGSDSEVCIDEDPSAIQYTPGDMFKRGQPSYGRGTICLLDDRYVVAKVLFPDNLPTAGSEVSGMVEQYCSFRMVLSVKEALMTFPA